MHIYDFTIQLGAGTECDPYRFFVIDVVAPSWPAACEKVGPGTKVIGGVKRGVAVVRPVEKGEG
jgi:hypothetical protein